MYGINLIKYYTCVKKTFKTFKSEENSILLFYILLLWNRFVEKILYMCKKNVQNVQI